MDMISYMGSYLFNVEYLLSEFGCCKGMKSDHVVLFVSGIGLTIISILFILHYLDFYAIKQFENKIVMPIGLTGVQNPLNLFVFAIVFAGGIGLLVKGFT
jgi:hypothetical protein